MGNKERQNETSHSRIKEAFTLASAKRELSILESTMESYSEACFKTEEPLFEEFMKLYPLLWKQIADDEKSPIATTSSTPVHRLPWRSSFSSAEFFFPETADFIHLQTTDHRVKYFKNAVDNPDYFLRQLQEQNINSTDDFFLDQTLEKGGRVIYYKVSIGMPIPRGPMNSIVNAMLEKAGRNQTNIDIENWERLDEKCEKDLLLLSNEYSVRLKAKIFNAALEVEKIAKLPFFKPEVSYDGKEYEMDLSKSEITHKGKSIEPNLYNQLAPAYFQKLSSYLPK